MSSSSTSSSRGTCRQISLDAIRVATDNFAERNVLGKGGEGKVYLANIEHGWTLTQVAVKQLRPNSTAFGEEIKTMSNIQHKNVVSLLGYCDDYGQKILIYEYMEKGSLSNYVRKSRTSSTTLPWLQRLRICLDAARGIQHMHVPTKQFPKGIIHRDIKPHNILLGKDNILLGKDWVAKISDFGLFKVSVKGQVESVMKTNLKGTSGYFAPEYNKFLQVTRKIDVYAFGVVLFQVLCLKMPWDRGDESYDMSEDEDLGLWAEQNIDPEIEADICDDSLKAYAGIIGESLKQDPNKRPTMDDVVRQLEKAIEYQEIQEERAKNDRAAKESDEHTTAGSHWPIRIDLMEQVMKALSNDEIYMIGICGMAGVGKTWLADEVKRRVMEEKLFDAAVKVDLSQVPEIPGIQHVVACSLGLDLYLNATDDQNERARKLLSRLTDGSKNLIILDNIWDIVELHRVGLPLHGKEKGCKVLFTSQNANLPWFMDAAKVEVLPLSTSEARLLFKTIAGKYEDIADKLADECGGLPLAIDVVAWALHNKSRGIWESVLNHLKELNATKEFKMEELGNAGIKLMYNVVGSCSEPDAQTLLLMMCCLFPAGANISHQELIRYVLELRLLKSSDNPRDTINRVYKLLYDLMNRCLLLRGEEEMSVKMNRVVRDACLSISSEEDKKIFKMEELVSAPIKLNYDLLGSSMPEAQTLLLMICCLFPAGAEIPPVMLVRYVMELKLLKSSDNLRDTINRVHELLDELKNRCLLLRGEEERNVKMNRVVRDACLSISSEEDKKRFNMEELVSARIKLRYDLLGSKNPEAQTLLHMICCLFPAGADIHYHELDRYVEELKLLKSSDNLGNTSIRVFRLLAYLKDHSLLLHGEKNITVKMDRVVRDVCLSILSEEDKKRFQVKLKHKPKLMELPVAIAIAIAIVTLIISSLIALSK